MGHELVEPVWDEYDDLIPWLPVPGIVSFPYDKKLDRKFQAHLKKVRAEMIAEYERNKAKEAAETST